MATWRHPIHPEGVARHRHQALLPRQIGIVDRGHLQPQPALLCQANQLLAEPTLTRPHRTIERQHRALTGANQPFHLGEHGHGQPLHQQGIYGHNLLRRMSGYQISGHQICGGGGETAARFSAQEPSLKASRTTE